MTSGLVVGTAGHIDHGKSALVKALTGTDPDRLKEEQARGITIDLGFAHTEIGGATIAFVDVPGHERFVRNMLAGAGGIDAVVLVVAADESVMPQTREHFHICRLLGIERGIVALTKADLVSDELRAIAASDVADLVRGSFLESAPIVAVSARTGEGLDALRAALGSIAGAPPRQGRAGVTRLPIDRVFAAKGFGVVVTGTLVSGAIASGDSLALLPGARPVRVRGLQVHGRTASRVEAPSRLAVNLSGVEIAEVSRGQTLATAGALPVTRRVDVVLHLLADSVPLRHGTKVRVHHGTSEVLGRVVIGATRARPDADWVLARPGAVGLAIPAGGDAYVRLRLDAPAILTRGDRIVIRAHSPAVTVGGGVVLDPEPASTGLRRAAALDRFRRLDGAPDDRALDVLLAEAAGQGVERAAIAPRLGLGAEAAGRLLSNAAANRRLVITASRAFVESAADRTATDLLAALAAFHRIHPLEGGMPRETLRVSLSSRVAVELIDRALEMLTAQAAITGTDRLALADHRPAVSDEERRVRHEIVAAIHAAGLMPPDAASLAEATGAERAVVDRIVAALVREKVLARLEGLTFHADVLNGLKADVKGRRMEPGGATVDVASFKQRYGLSRKFAIPLLEWLDRERVTRRSGEKRVVL